MGRTLILTTPHMHGNDVHAFQNALTRNKYYHGPLNAEYDVLTAQAAYTAKYWLGYLKPDHAAGDLLYGYLLGHPTTIAMRARAVKRRRAIPKLTLGQKALAVMLKYEGVKENPAGSNHTQFGVWYGVDRAPWCNILVSYCYVSAGSKAFVRGHDYSYVPTMDADARAGRNNLRIAHPGPITGDVVTFDWDHDGNPDHTGLFIKWLDDAHTKFESIEGNTGIGNNSNGGEVLKRNDRVVSEVRTFIHVGA